MEQEARKTARERLALRNEEIMRLKRRGFTNLQIAARMDLHEKSVARIGGRMRRYMVFRGPNLP
jgi:DNA-binding CsgD family transcriptional regulator